MHRAILASLLLVGDVRAHPGHGAAEGHLHGFGPELILLALLLAAWAVLRSK